MKTLRKIVIAIDGFSSSGKSSFAKSIAGKLGYMYIDSGAMYRAVALYCMQNNIFSNNNLNINLLPSALQKVDISFKINEHTGEQEVYLNGESVEKAIRTVEVSNVVSIVSSEAVVREKLVALQKKMGEKKGIVMDGRDIGTVVFPDAEFKIYLVANVEVRAKRRYEELLQKGQQVNYEEIKQNIEQRDHLDLTRKTSPLKKADDALELDNSYMTPAEQMEWVMSILKQKQVIE